MESSGSTSEVSGSTSEVTSGVMCGVTSGVMCGVTSGVLFVTLLTLFLNSSLKRGSFLTFLVRTKKVFLVVSIVVSRVVSKNATFPTHF